MTDRKLPTQEMLENVRNLQCCQPAIAEGCYYIILADERDALLFAAEELARLEIQLSVHNDCPQESRDEIAALRARLARIDELAREAAALGVDDDHMIALDVLVTAILHHESSDAE